MSGKKTTPNLFATKRSVPKKDAISVLPYSEEYRKKQAAKKVEQFKQADPIKQKALRKEQIVQSNPFLDVAERKVFTERLDIEDVINKVKKETTVNNIPAQTPVTAPEVMPVYAPVKNPASNSKFQVNPVTAQTQKLIEQAANNNTLQTWFLDDGDSLVENTVYADSEFPTIGKNRLSGTTETDRVVIAVPNEDGSFSLFKYSRPDDEYADAKDDADRYSVLMETCSSYFEDKSKNYISEIEALDKELDALQQTAVQTDDGVTLSQEDYDKYQALVARRQVVADLHDDSANAYKEAYSKWLGKYDEANKRLNAKGMRADEYGFYETLKARAQAGNIPGTDVDRLSKVERMLLEQYEERVQSGNINILPNEAYLAQLDKAASTFESAKQKSKENDIYSSDMYSAEQINSYRDVLVRQISRTVFDIDNGTSVLQDFTTATVQSFLNPYKYMIDHWDEADAIAKLASDEIIEKYKDPKYAHMTDSEKQIAISTESFIGARIPAFSAIMLTTGKTMLNNAFVNLGENFDISNYLIKPFIVGLNFAEDNVVLEQNLKNNINLKALYEDAVLNRGTMSVQDRMGVNAWMDAWGANGTTPSYEYDMLWREGENSWAAALLIQLPLELMFDPATWVGAGVKAAASGQIKTISKVEDILRSTWVDAGMDISEDAISKYAKQIVTRAIANGEELQETFSRIALKGIKESSTATPWKYAKHLESIPKNSALSFVEARKSQKLALTAAVAKAADGLPDALGTSYKVVGTLSTVASTLNKIDSALFSISVPPILARNTLRFVRNLVTTIAAVNPTQAKLVGNMTERISNKIINEIATGDSRSVLSVQLDEAAQLVAREVNSVAHLLDNKILDEYTSSVVAGIAKQQSNREITKFQDIIRSGKSADRTLAALDNYCAELTKGTSFAHVQTFPEYLKLMTQNIELYKTAFDNAAIARLRQLQKKYTMLRADGRIAKMKELKRVTEEASAVVQKSFTNVPYRMALFDYTGNNTGLKISYNKMLGEYKNLFNTFLDDFSPTPKSELTAVFRDAQASLTALFDAYATAMHMPPSPERTAMVRNAFRSLSDSNAKISKLTNDYLGKIETQRMNTALSNYHNPIRDEVSTLDDMPDFTQNNLRDLCTTIAENLSAQTDTNIAPEKILETLKHGVEDCLNADGSLDTERISRLYRIDLDKLSKSAAYISNPDLQKYTKELLDYKGVSYDTLLEVGMTLVDDEHTAFNSALNTVYTKLLEYTNHTELFKSVLALENQGVDKVFITGFLDAISGNVSRINRVFRETAYENPGALSRTADKITDIVVDDAVDFIMGTHSIQNPGRDGVKLWRRGCNTVDTSTNVSALESIIQNPKQTSVLEALADPDGKYIDVLYSVSMTNKHTIPFMSSFKVDGQLSTFMNKDIPFAAKGNTEAVYGVPFEDALAQYNKASGAHAGLSEADYIKQMDDFMYSLKTKAGKEGKQLRFIGFNNSTMGNNQDRYLELIVRRHVMDVHETMMIDVANIIRHDKHIPVVPKEAVASLRSTMEHALEYGVGQNTLYGNVAGLVSSPADGIDNAVGMLIREIDNAKPILKQELSLPPGTLDIAQEQLRNLRIAYRNSMQLNTNAMEGLNGIHLDEFALRKLVEAETGNKLSPVRLNCMNLIRKNIGHSFNYNLITDINTIHMGAWYDLAKVTPDYAQKHSAVQRLMTDLERTYNSIAYPELVEEIPREEYLNYIQKHLHAFEAYALDAPESAGFFAAYTALNLDNMDNIQLYSVCRQIRYNIPVKYTTLLSEAYRFDLKTVEDFIVCGADLLTADGRTVVYDLERANVIASRYASPVAQANEFAADLEQLDTLAEQLQSFDGYLAMLDNLYEENRMLSPKERIKGTLFATVNTPFKEFVTRLNEFAPNKNVYKVELAEANTVLRRAQIRKEYSDSMSRYKKVVGSLSGMHSKAVAMNVLSLDNADFTAHVIRNCKNALIINPKASVFRLPGMSELLYKKLDELKKQTELIVRYEDGVLKIYKDVSALKGVELDTFLRTYDKAVVPSAYTNYQNGIKNALRDSMTSLRDIKQHALENRQPFNTSDTIKHIYNGNKDIQRYMSLDEFYMHMFDFGNTQSSFAKLTEQLTKYMPADYYFSTGDVITQDAVSSLYEMIPKEAHLDLGLINSGSGYRWFDDSFMCSIIGDVDDFKKVNPYYTNNIVSNIGAGIHHVRNNLEATTDYFALYDNPTQSLKHMVEVSGRATDFKSVKRALDNNGYVLHKGEIAINKHGEQIWEIKQIKLDSRGDFIKAMNDPRVICTPNEVLMQMKAFAKGETLNWRAENASNARVHMMEMYKLWSQRIRSMRNINWLFMTPISPALRNWSGAGTNAYAAAGDVKLFNYMGNAKELNARYGDIYADMLEEYGNVTGDIVHEYFYKYRNNAAKLKEFDLDTFAKLFAHKESSAAGFSGAIDYMKENQSRKLVGLIPDAARELFTERPVLDEAGEVAHVLYEEVESAQKIYQKVFNKHAHEVKKEAAIIKEEVRKALELSKLYTPAQVDVLSSLYTYYIPSNDMAMELIQRVPVIGKALAGYLDFNKANFSAAEDVTRTGMAMYYADNFGMSMNRANMEVIASQFDYSNRSLGMDIVETLFPFSTFKIYNTAFWMFDAPNRFNAIRTMTKYGRVNQMQYDSEELMLMNRNMALREKIASGELNYQDNEEDAEDSGFLTSVVNAYTGVPSLYSEDGGNIKLGKNHVLKAGNTFVDALSMVQSILMAVPELLSGQVPSIFADNIYAPISTLLGLVIPHMLMGEGADWDEVLRENYYDLFDLVPVVGGMANLVMSHLKSGNLSIADLQAINTNPQLQDEYGYRLSESLFNVLGMVLPGLVGTVSDKQTYLERPVGTDWYNQTEEYKKTHRYVFGISAVPSYFTKDPETYVHYYGLYTKMGYEEEEVGRILSWMFGTPKPEEYQYKNDEINSALESLVDKGYTADEAIRLIQRVWLGATNIEEVDDRMRNLAFLKKYDMLPDYIKYEDGQYAQLKAWYVAQGYTVEQIWNLMSTQNPYMDEQGDVRYLTQAQADELTSSLNTEYIEYMDGLPDWMQYEPGASTRTIAYLIGNGIVADIDQARDYITANHFYVDPKGKAVTYTDAENAAKEAASSTEFKTYYNNLPEYIKYEKGAFSRTISWLTKNGASSEEAKAMIKDGAYLTADGRLIDCRGLKSKGVQKWGALTPEEIAEFQAYFAKLPDYIKYEKGAYKRILKHLMDKEGMSYEDAKSYMLKNYVDVDANGKLILYSQKDIDKMKTDKDAAFKAFYDSLPDYIKFEKGAYSRTYAYLKAQGYDKATIMNMIKEGAYLSLATHSGGGKIINVKGLKKPRRVRRPNRRFVNNYKARFKKQRKPFKNKRSFGRTYSATNSKRGHKFGAQTTQKITLGYNRTRTALGMASGLPATYRNVAHSNRKNMYREMYAKYGLSRMIIRSNAWHSYSNASITRLRRNEIKNKMKYQTRRSSF